METVNEAVYAMFLYTQHPSRYSHTTVRNEPVSLPAPKCPLHTETYFARSRATVTAVSHSPFQPLLCPLMQREKTPNIAGGGVIGSQRSKRDGQHVRCIVVRCSAERAWGCTGRPLGGFGGWRKRPWGSAGEMAILGIGREGVGMREWVKVLMRDGDGEICDLRRVS